MKYITKTNMTALLILCAFSSAQASQLSPMVSPSKKVSLVNVLPSKVFAPTGFDDNDKVQVVLYGQYPNTCYKAGPVEHTIDPQNPNKIIITPKAYVVKSGWCLPVLVQYTQVVNLEILDKGNYELNVKGQASEAPLQGSLTIAEAYEETSPDNNPHPSDDYFYAPVTEVSINTDGSIKEQPISFTIRGIFPYDCMKLKEVKIIRKNPQILEVLPIMQNVPQGTVCSAQIKPFEETIKLDENLTGTALIHVRALNGNSLNRVIEINPAN